MINKQGLWFLTLFTLILVLGVYYVTMPNEMFKSFDASSIKDNNNDNTDNTSKSSDTNKEKKTSSVSSDNTSYIETLKIELDTERAEILNTLEDILNDKSKNSSEKNKAYEQMKEINNLKASEDMLSKKISNQYKLSSYIKQEDNTIEVVIDSKKHDVKLANKIMRTIQNEFSDPMSISVKFS